MNKVRTKDKRSKVIEEGRLHSGVDGLLKSDKKKSYRRSTSKSSIKDNLRVLAMDSKESTYRSTNSRNVVERQRDTSTNMKDKSFDETRSMSFKSPSKSSIFKRSYSARRFEDMRKGEWCSPATAKNSTQKVHKILQSEVKNVTLRSSHSDITPVTTGRID